MNYVLGFFALIIIIIALWRLLSKFFSLPCPSWLGWMVEVDNPFVKIHQAKTIIEHLHLEPGMTVLDAGCGPGRVTIPLAKAVGTNGNVVGLDLQPGMLERTKMKADAENINNIQLMLGTLGGGQLEKEKFDRVVLVTVLGEIPNKENALKELYFSLKSDGILSITETIFDPPHYQRMQTVLELAQRAGFKEKNRFGNFVAYTLNLVKR